MIDTTAELSQFAFRGERNYLHSTTLFDHLLTGDPNPRTIDFRFHAMTGKQCEIRPSRDAGDGQRLVASYQSDGMSGFCYATNIPITDRYPCNEKQIEAAVQLVDKAACFSLPPVSGASFIEAVVAAYKALLHHRLPDLGKKLLFARITLDEVPEAGLCEVEHRRRVGDDFFEAVIRCQQVDIGKLYFGAK